jgi:hypothetical protein
MVNLWFFIAYNTSTFIEMGKVIGIKAEDETFDKFEKITKKSNKDWLEKKINKDTEKEKIAFPSNEKNEIEKFITIPVSEYEFLINNTGSLKHATQIFERVIKYSETVNQEKNFSSVFDQLEAFWKMNNMRLTKRKDGSEWIIDCQHGIGRAFSRFFFHLVNKICMWSDEYELYDKKVLDDSLILFIKKIPISKRKKRLTKK